MAFKCPSDNKQHIYINSMECTVRLLMLLKRWNKRNKSYRIDFDGICNILANVQAIKTYVVLIPFSGQVSFEVIIRKNRLNSFGKKMVHFWCLDIIIPKFRALELLDWIYLTTKTNNQYKLITERKIGKNKFECKTTFIRFFYRFTISFVCWKSLRLAFLWWSDCPLKCLCLDKKNNPM